MTYEARETSRYQGKPVSLFLFRYGETAGAYFAYTNAETEISHQGIVYKPIPIERDSYSASGSLDKSTMQIRTPQNVELAEMFKTYPPSQVVTCVVREGHLDDPDNEFLVVWSGRVLNSARQVNTASYSCEPSSTSLRRTGLRRHYQFGCPHVLYGDQCRANKSAATASHMVLQVNKAFIRLADGWNGAVDQAKFLDGAVEWTTLDNRFETRRILRIDDGHTLLLSGPAQTLAAGMAIDTVLGCNHMMSDCRDLHGNIHNFGGQPWIPYTNPIGITNNYR